VLDGGGRRGLVAIDPGPCLGDPAYDAIDLLVWQAGDIATIEARAALLATAIGVDVARLLDWCVAFAGMFALDLAGQGQRHADNWRDRAEPFLRLAAQVSS
jgi:streptomycin 6-kinase